MKTTLIDLCVRARAVNENVLCRRRPFFFVGHERWDKWSHNLDIIMGTPPAAKTSVESNEVQMFTGCLKESILRYLMVLRLPCWKTSPTPKATTAMPWTAKMAYFIKGGGQAYLYDKATIGNPLTGWNTRPCSRRPRRPRPATPIIWSVLGVAGLAWWRSPSTEIAATAGSRARGIRFHLGLPRRQAERAMRRLNRTAARPGCLTPPSGPRTGPHRIQNHLSCIRNQLMSRT